MTVKTIYSFLDKLFPFDSACDFDNVGLLVGDENAEVKTAVIALDCTDGAVDFAIKHKAELIITHHPVIFEGLKAVTENTPVFKCIKNGISVISAHTNLDLCDGGVNDALCSVLELDSTEKIDCGDGFIFRKGNLKTSMNADELAEFASNRLKANARYVDGGKPVRTLAVCGGSGGDLLECAINASADALLTSEIKHHVFLEAKKRGITLLDLGHFATERIIVPVLHSTLSNAPLGAEFIPFNEELIKYI